MDRTEGAKKILGGRARFTAINHHLKISLLGAQHGRPRAKRSPRGLRGRRERTRAFSGARLEQTMNANCKLVKKNFDQAFSAFRPGRRGGNEGAGLVLSRRALIPLETANRPASALNSVRHLTTRSENSAGAFDALCAEPAPPAFNWGLASRPDAIDRVAEQTVFVEELPAPGG
jgi:hypothetical protein